MNGEMVRKPRIESGSSEKAVGQRVEGGQGVTESGHGIERLLKIRETPNSDQVKGNPTAASSSSIEVGHNGGNTDLRITGALRQVYTFVYPFAQAALKNIGDVATSFLKAFKVKALQAVNSGPAVPVSA